MFRTARPTNIPGLLRFAAQATPGLAYPSRRLGQEGRPASALRALLAPWLPHRGTMHTFLLTQGPRSGGLAALRGQRDLTSWEVDQLLLAPCSMELCAELLARLDSLVVQVRGQRVFLRLVEGSPILDAAREAGYYPYVVERLYHRPASAARSVRLPDPDLEVRPRRPEDDYPLFRLYCAATPVAVRAAEGLTFREWQEASSVRWPGGPRSRDLLVLRAGAPVAWARIAQTSPSGGPLIALLAHPQEARQGSAVSALHTALQQAPGAAPARVLAQEDAPSLADLLRDAGFLPGSTYTSLVHQVGARLREPAFMPAGI